MKRHIRKNMIELISRLSIKTKLLFLFLTFSIILVLGVSILSYKSSSGIIDTQTDTYSQSILQQVKDRVDEMREEVLRVSMPIVINPYIQSNDIENLDLINFMNHKKNIDSELSLALFLKNYISSVYLCYGKNTVISTEYVGDGSQINFREFSTYKKAIENITKPVWIGTHENEFKMDKNKSVISFVRSLYDKENFQPIGILIMNVPDSVLDNICSENENYNIIISDRDGNIVYKSRNISSEADKLDRSCLGDIIKNKDKNGALTWENGSNKYRVQYMISKNEDWIYIAEVSVNFLMQNSTQVRNNITVILFIGILMSVAAAYLIASYFTIPIKEMTRNMKKVQKGDFNINLNIKDKGEIGQLAEHYSVMVKEIKNLIEKIKHESKEKREAELDALQAQITPHFLYNTLNSIKCTARVQRIDSIENMTEALIELLRLSISKKTVFITVAEEIDIIKKYIFIQKFRQGNRFTVEYECNEAALEYMTIKMILQPIIENAIIHGLEPKNGSGCIKVKVYKADNDICFGVEDNGIGMDKTQIDSMLLDDNISSRRFSGIGIKNINERIVMHFGEAYGITFKSIPGECTKVLVKIPAVMESEVQNFV